MYNFSLLDKIVPLKIKKNKKLLENLQKSARHKCRQVIKVHNPQVFDKTLKSHS